MGQKSTQNRSKIGSRGQVWVQKRERRERKFNQKSPSNIKTGRTPQGRSIFAKNVANMAATWHPKSSQNRKKSILKSTTCLRSFLSILIKSWLHFGSILAPFWLQAGPSWPKLTPSWPQVGGLGPFMAHFSEKAVSSRRNVHFWEGLGGQG